MTLAFPLFFLVLISCSALVLDIGRANMVRGELQTKADAAALAGAMTADVVRETGALETEQDASGNVTSIKEIPGKATLKLRDADKAYQAARRAEEANGGSGFVSKVMGEYEVQKEEQILGSEETGWSGRISGDRTYTTETRVELKPGFLSFLGFKGVTIYTGGTGEAILLKEGGD
jgi:hypothetical protein